MSEQAPQEDRTEEATPAKRKRSREQGQVAKSRDLASAVMLAAGAGAIFLIAEGGAPRIARIARGILGRLDEGERLIADPGLFVAEICAEIAVALAAPIALLVAAALAAHLAQTGPLWSWSKLEFKFSKIDPLSGFKRVFLSKDAAFGVAKSIAQLIVCAAAAGAVLTEIAPAAPALTRRGPIEAGRFLYEVGLYPMAAAAAAMIALGGADFWWSRRKTAKQMRMTKEEVKREMKQTEGDPMLASKRKARHRELMQVNKMIAAVESASVVVNNPTHVSVALRYGAEDGAPIVIAKGVDQIAMRIREKAERSNIPMVTNVPLARGLHASCAVDHPIPEVFFRAVAQVLAAVWRQDGPKRAPAPRR